MEPSQTFSTNASKKPGTKPLSPFWKRIRKYLYIILAITAIFLILFVYWKFFFTYSDGYRAGLLQKFSRKGTIFKTFEGEMILSSVKSSQNVALASEKFVFSVTDESLATRLDSLQGEDIVVHYKEKNASLPWRGESVYIVGSVKVSK